MRSQSIKIVRFKVYISTGEIVLVAAFRTDQQSDVGMRAKKERLVLMFKKNVAYGF